jgi:hypothetical protein
MRSQPHTIQPSKASARIALVYKNFSLNKSVSHIGLGVCAINTARTLRQHGYWADVWAAAHVDDIRDKLLASNAAAVKSGEHPVSHVVISAPWLSTQDTYALVTVFPNVNFSVISHSNFGFLAADPNAIRLLREGASIEATTTNFRIGGNCSKFTTAWERMYGTPMLLLPNLYDVSTMQHVGHRRPWHSGQTLRVGIFGATRPLKNMVTAVSASIELGHSLHTDLEIWMSSGRNEGGSTVTNAIAQLVAGLPTVKLVQSGWQSWPEFRSLVGKMHLLMQPSYTESFNMVTADGIASGVTSVVGEAIDWVPVSWEGNVDDVSSLARVGRALLHDVHAVDDGQHKLREYVRHGLMHWEQYLLQTA